jgi:UDP-glucose 4-epimerase
MRVVVTGSVGHLGEALMRALSQDGYEVVGFDLPASPYTGVVGSILDRALVRQCVEGADAVVHTTTLHKPHVGTHDRQAFVDTNISGTLGLLEASAESGVKAFVFTSTTSAFGGALTPPPEAPAVWVTEDLEPAPRNIYGVTKTAAEDLSALLCRDRGLPCIILRTSRFFPELDDWAESRTAFDDLNGWHLSAPANEPGSGAGSPRRWRAGPRGSARTLSCVSGSSRLPRGWAMPVPTFRSDNAR